jgi:hypothetical protein
MHVFSSTIVHDIFSSLCGIPLRYFDSIVNINFTVGGERPD